MDNDDRKSEMNTKSPRKSNSFKLTSIHRSQIEQCEQRGGRYNLHVRQYFI